MKSKLYEVIGLINDINYGFCDDEGIVHLSSDSDYNDSFINKYRIKSPKELMKCKYGVCWDKTELERYYLENDDIECDSYCIVCYDGIMDPTHTFIVVQDNDKFYWLEQSWENHSGVKEYDSINSLLKDVKNEYSSMLIEDNVSTNNLCIYKYNKPTENFNCMEFYEYIKNSQLIDLEDDGE